MTLTPLTPPHPDRQPHRVHESRLSTVGTWVLVVAAMGADLAALYSVLQILFRSNDVVVAVGAVGLLAASVLAAHHVGVAAAQLRARDPRASRMLRNWTVAGWLAIGLAAAAVRVVAPGSASGFGTSADAGPHARDVLVALLFLAVHMACGLAVMHHARTHHNPLVAALRRARQERRAAAAAESRAGATAVRARAVLAQHRAEHQREVRRCEIARAGVLADLAELRHTSRVLLSIGLQDAPTTDGLTRRLPLD
ncbi:hypothetical protein [Pseudonocardia oroxyli]|uniref:Uncharacterized protein n=1 Tax=Pseudonocardia oroxyli TaxID=366584 RepID=A0A1G8CSV8_PSEOR|nr:hypothetical protein [Pseudonocardia oroxyli]SDH48259.1 hypothetical protein SAMN05216377_12340 [Pseudonocardia oroxyli]